jgi:hypothetical protein
MAAFTAFVVEATAYLKGVSRHFYVQEEVPSATDHEIMQVCRAVEAAGPARGRELAARLDDHQRIVLGMFGSRTPQMALADALPDDERPSVLAAGLIAEALANAGHTDFRDVLVGLALHYECARRIRLDPTDVFDAAAHYADDETAALMRIFGRRRDVTVKRFGWAEVRTPTGPAFVTD